MSSGADRAVDRRWGRREVTLLQSIDHYSGRQVVGTTPAVIVLLAGGVYIATQTLVVTEQLSEPLGVLIGLALGAGSVMSLVAGGASLADCHLTLGRLSLRGGLALLPILALWPFVLSTGTYTGPNPRAALLGALGAIGQELFFRSALLPMLLARTTRRRALILHTLAFGVWHAGALLAAPGHLGGAFSIILVSLGAGYAWAYQTARDRTVVWAMAHHAFLWVIGSFFDLSPPD
jgi:membrane protease YdiL (CAAX protease family)